MKWTAYGTQAGITWIISYYDLHNFSKNENKLSDPVFRFLHSIHFSFTQTVEERESMETKADLQKAKLACEYQEILICILYLTV